MASNPNPTSDSSPVTASQALESQKQRNKLNQRAFRQRRQQRVQELEEKLRQHESAQLKATQQMQQAARVVAAENAMLRDVLKQRLGMGEREIEQLRREWINGIENRNVKGSSQESAGGHIPSLDSVNAEKNQITQHGQQVSCGVNLSKSHEVEATTQKISRVQCCDQISKFASNEPQNNQESSVFMSCEKAAEILSSIRSQDELYDVRARLGCTSPNTCMIENIKVMDVMNESI